METTQRIPQQVLTVIPKVDECKALAVGEDPDTQYKQPSQKLFDTRVWEQAGTSQ